jgi:hypothetical protein
VGWGDRAACWRARIGTRFLSAEDHTLSSQSGMKIAEQDHKTRQTLKLTNNNNNNK